MASVRREVVIHRSASDVWDRIGDPVAIREWFPGMTDASVEGSVRLITTATGLPLPETILINDPIQRRFQYRLDLPVVRFHRGTIDVIALDSELCLVVYSTDCEPDPMALVVGGATGNALHELKRQMEST